MDRFYFRYWDGKDMMLIGLGTLAEGSHGEIDLSEVKIMQSTGLRDKNGKLIYEGDILRYYWPPDPSETHIAPVVWNADQAAFDGDIISTSDNHGAIMAMQFNNCDIIGNIYENPELIKGR